MDISKRGIEDRLLTLLLGFCEVVGDVVLALVIQNRWRGVGSRRGAGEATCAGGRLIGRDKRAASKERAKSDG